MAKTRNHSVRFDEDNFNFACKREGIKSGQKLIDFLLSEYCKLYRVEKKSVFEPGPSLPESKSWAGNLQNNVDKILLEKDEPTMFSEPINIAKEYQSLVDNFRGDNEEGELLMRKILAEQNLTKWQRESLQKQLNSKAI